MFNGSRHGLTENKDTNTQLMRKRIYLEVKLEEPINKLFLAVNALPQNQKDDLLSYFNGNQLDCAQLPEFHKDIAKKLRTAKCYCTAANVACCSITFFFCCLLSAIMNNKGGGHFNFDDFFSDSGLVQQLTEIKKLIEIINEDYCQLQSLTPVDNNFEKFTGLNARS